MARSTLINFRLRPGRDSDIIEALEGIPENTDRSEVIRAALRAYFNLGIPNPLPIPEKPSQDALRKLQPLNMDDITLEHIEKSADDMDDALDDLLGDF